MFVLNSFLLHQDNIRMLLNVAAEQPDHELLLQKHFTALLSAAWRVNSRVEHQQNFPSSRNALYNHGSIFNSSVNQLTSNSSEESAKRMKRTNLGHSSKLLAAALHDASRRPDDRVSYSNLSDVAPFTGEQLVITLEFQKEEDDSFIQFPPIISLSIPGSAPLTSVNKDRAEAQHLRASTSTAENRFRYDFLQSRRWHWSACLVLTVFFFNSYLMTLKITALAA